VPTSIRAAPPGVSHAEKPHSLPGVTGLWNPLLDRIRFYERTERLIRRSVPGTDPTLRSEREGNLNG
jgi:hypothetical protein